MKTIRFAIIILFFSNFMVINAQNGSIIKDSILKKGIYKNYDEFKTNTPSIPFSYEINSKKRSRIRLGSIEKTTYYRIKIDRKKSKKIGSVFGFCDGKNIYIKYLHPFSANPTKFLAKLSSKTEFRKIERIGKYAYFENISIDNSTGIVAGPNFNTFERKLLDIEDGEIIRLAKQNVKRIIADDKELLESFKNESNKKKKIKEYIKKYIQRNGSIENLNDYEYYN
ncbi:hypothetical protein [Aquimarina sp. MMG016]|uniref:hypothetical protein n=1 Tax=Aquimarina sp. MMG016 TaxID=2822690 RepID=UPI001B3A5CE9|nr:hypothetical protein [Aquimarina sp. MMG016]MBQ4820975.1 hypothetical protein [Aquimarina sp. MMG016]